MPRRFIPVGISLLWVASLLGCGESNPYQHSPVSGVITLDDKPLSNAFVNFQPNGGLGSTAITDSEGKYSLTTIDGEEGAVVGQHRVSIYSVHNQETSDSDVDPPNAPKERVPRRYNYQTTLTLEVSSEGTKEADWKLSTKR